MAPQDRPDIDHVEDQIKDIIQGLYQVMVQVSQYDAVGGRPSREVITNELTTLSASLQAVHRTATAASNPANPTLSSLPSIPLDLVQYVENGRNPDIYTREFVELVRRGNQLMRGKVRAFASFRDILAGEMRTALPELAADVDRVVEATGGALEDARDPADTHGGSRKDESASAAPGHTVGTK